MSERLIVGCMSGTSLDGVDAALVRVTGEGLEMKAQFVRGASVGLGPLGERLRMLAVQQKQPVKRVARSAVDLARAHNEVLDQLIDGEQVDFVAVHGQTVFHEPPLSLQLVNPHVIAQHVKAPVLFDLRGADLAAGGQGAPITPLADYILFHDPAETRAVVNFGGFANYSLLPSGGIDAVRGGDVCVCNQLLDTVAREVFNLKYDEGGKMAVQGKLQTKVFASALRLLQDQASGGRSLGTGDEMSDWVAPYIRDVVGKDLVRSAVAAIAEVVCRTIGSVDRLILSGGGANNEGLLREMAERAETIVCLSEGFGVPSQFREAIAMAVLGALSADRVPITLPAVTGGPEAMPVAGAWVYA